MSVYVLPYNSDKQISKHINARELRCKCGGTHNITVNTDLIDKAERLISTIAEINKLSADDVHIAISSANRCKQHDINVGGSGWGMHTLGKAIDFQIYYKDAVVDTRLIACIAQELGFTGIGRITAQYIHCDVGTLAEHGGRKWLGDEMVKGGTSGSIVFEPNTYWNYYGIDRNKYFPEPVKSTEKWLQESLNALGENLIVDGVIGVKTLEAMKRHPIKQGERGDYVKIVQQILNAKGYDCGTPDGIAGNKTTSAICSAAWDRLFG